MAMNRRLSVASILISVLAFYEQGVAQESRKDSVLIPIWEVFDGYGRNALGSVEYNYGLNYVVGAAATYGLVENGFDWRWYRNALEHPWIRNTGFVSVGVGPLVSVFAPLGLYLYGRHERDGQLQMTGLALGQAAIQAAVITSVIKAFTGRPGPEEHGNPNDYSRDFRFGFLRGGIYEGWPSSHTCAAFAMAVTLTKLYPDNSTIQIASLAYASLIGLGVSTNIHWFSDVIAGGLIGYVIGASVGDGYWNLMHGGDRNQSCNFSVTPNGIMLSYHF